MWVFKCDKGYKGLFIFLRENNPKNFPPKVESAKNKFLRISGYLQTE